MKDELQKLLTNPEVFPIEITLTSGDKLKIPHPDYIHYAKKLGQVFFYPEVGGGLFEWFAPEQIAKIQGRIKQSSLYTG